MEKRAVIASELVEAGEDVTVLLELADETLDEVPLFVAFTVVITRLSTVFARWNYCLSPPIGDGFEDSFCVIGFVSQDELAFVTRK